MDEAESLLVFAAEKAGMGHVDRQQVNQIILSLSKDSDYFKNEARKAAHVEEKLRALQPRTASEQKALKNRFEKQIEKLLKEVESSPLRIWVHIDMDMFYAAVELLDHPELRGKPIAVGGMSMISTASYEARQYGVRSAMPGFIGKALCPDLIFISSSKKSY
jgi:DNA polymerase kappa